MRTTQSFTKDEVERKWYLVDLEGVPLGRAAARIATILRGKHKPQYTPHADVGDFVVAVNAGKVRLTGGKADKQYFRWHTGYTGHLREMLLSQMLRKKPEELFRRTVRGMLPKGPLGRAMLRKLKVYAGPNHPHEAQKPVKIDVTSRFVALAEVKDG